MRGQPPLWSQPFRVRLVCGIDPQNGIVIPLFGNGLFIRITIPMEITNPLHIGITIPLKNERNSYSFSSGNN
jgi:hypothetical protein